MLGQDCLSDADLNRLWEGDLDDAREEVLQRHLATCRECRHRWERVARGGQYLESLFSNNPEDSPDDLCHQYAREGDAWWSQYVGHQLLGLLAQVPDELDALLEMIKAVPLPTPAMQTIKLPLLEPSESPTQRLAAGTGDGLTEQTLRQEEPPFEFHLVQFGKQLRIDIRSLDETSPYRDCLGRLELLEGTRCLLGRMVLVEEGQSHLNLDPQETATVRPKEALPGVRFIPIVNLAQLEAAGSEGYLPILSKLLQHEDPTIRAGAAMVTDRIMGPQARTLLSPLAEDEDENVRIAVRRVLSSFGEPSTD